ncbi:MAG: DUF4390 domain-containing protein [Candidatus Eisenbacteria bacterium]|uniref:DUF4390 domain-containing protein n=1 Tax=Eiseniibacteriota bacterium TaxID=2212470 RepID=A0A7Y2E9W9_UNCEI|nr:DUF4390 domain-containing protein [Candidatus Eisenbacteria bacterium]
MQNRGPNTKGLRSLFVAIVIAGWLLPATVHAFSITVEAPRTNSQNIPGAGGTEDTLVAKFSIDNLFDPEALSSLGEGVPATLTLVVDLWRVRAGWWDASIRTQELTYRFRHDRVSSQYLVRNPDRTITECENKTALLAHIQRIHEIVLAPAEAFPENKTFYISIKAVLQPVNLEDLEKVDAWLSGDVTSQGGGVLGLPRTFASLLFGISGFGDRQALGRSELFVPNPKQP